MAKYFFTSKFDYKTILKLLILISFVQVTQASSSLESLKEIAQQCRQKVDELWKQQRRLPPVQRRDFHIAIGQASKSCDDIRDLLKQFNQLNALKQSYEKSLNEAQNLTQTLQDAP